VLLDAFSNEICHSFCQELTWNSALLFPFFALRKGGSNGGVRRNIAYSPPADTSHFATVRDTPQTPSGRVQTVLPLRRDSAAHAIRLYGPKAV
jgi:hypothetical protein